MYINQLDDGTIELTAPVMIPGAKDCDYKNGEPPLTREQIRTFAKTYEHYGFVDHEHGLTRNGERIGVPVKSFLLSEPTTMTILDGSMKSYPEGSWFITTHLTDEDAINTALEGGYTGYSASVFSKNRADMYLEALKTDKDTPLPTACKSISSGGTALIKDVPDPVVLSVSLVKTPCLHDSKFCEYKPDGEIMEEDVKSLKSRMLEAMGMGEAAEVEALKSEVSDLKETITSMQSEFSEALKSMQEEFTKTLTEALTPVAEKTEAEVVEVEEEVEDEPAAEKTEEPVVEEEVEDVEAEPEEETVEVQAEKGESKAEPVHDNLQAEKKHVPNIYEVLGRNPDGTRKL